MKIKQALEIIYRYGGIDGAHHKAWVIDQILRALLGDKYEKWVKDSEEGGEYEWNVGIAP